MDNTKLPPRLYVNLLNKRQAAFGVCDYNCLDQRVNTAQEEYISLTEHKKILKELLDNQWDSIFDEGYYQGD